MTADEYLRLTRLSENKDYDFVRERLAPERNLKLLHYVLGLGTEVGELQDIIKKHIIYGKLIDPIHLAEELGDVLWYIARLLSLIPLSFEEAMSINIAKLKTRYPDGFTETAALIRDLTEEKRVLDMATQDFNMSTVITYPVNQEKA